MTAAVLADTGPLYAAVDPSDAHHDEAQAALAHLEKEHVSVIVPSPILCEAHSLIMRRLGVRTGRRWLRDIATGASLLSPIPEDYGAAIGTIEDLADQPLTLFDAVLAALSRRLGYPVWTYDHHFDLMGNEVWR